MCAFKLPVDQEYAIRQSFAAFLLLTPLFFSEFLDSNDKGNGAQGLKQDPVAPPQPATGACRPWGGRQGPVARWGGDRPHSFFFLQGLRCKFEEKKLHLSTVAPHRATGVYF